MAQKKRLSGYRVIRSLIVLLIHLSFVISHSSFSLDVPRFYGEEVVVTASRLPQLKSQSPWDTTTIASAELKSFKTVGEALRIVAGADVISYGNLGSVTSVRLRGANSSQVLVMIDGRRINSPTLGMFDVGDLLLDNVAKIEVVRAPLSAIYGSDALSGVINIITKSPKEPTKTFTAMTGSFGTQQYKVELNNEKFLLSVGQLKSGGFRANGDYLSTNVYGKLVQPLPIGQFFVDYNLYDAKKGVPGVPISETDPASASEPNDRQTDRNTFASAGLKNDNFQLRVYQNILDQRLSPYIFGVSTNEAQQTGLEWSQNFELSIGKILYGLEGREDRGKTTMSGDHAINNYAAFVQDEVQVGDRATITASIRGDKHSTAGTSINPRAGFVYQAADNLLFRASAGTAFRAPTLNELYWNDVNWNMFGDVNLKPEKSVSYEFGLERRLADKTSARINYFTSSVTDLILWAYDPSTYVTQVKNIGEVQSEGVEVELARGIGQEGKGFINYTCQKVIDKKDANPLVVDKTIPYTPINKYTVGLVSGGTSLLIKSVGERYADQTNVLKLAAYTVVDFKISRQVSDAINVELAANNLFDEKYAEVVGYDPATFAPRNYPMPGRNYSIGVKWEL